MAQEARLEGTGARADPGAESAAPAKEKIRAAGEDWTKDNTLKELRDLDQNLWDNFEKRIPKDEYKKLSGWIKEKEHEQRRKDDQPEPKKNKREKEDRDFFEHGGKKFSSKDSYEKLTGLAKELRDNTERLPFDSYQKLRGWIEDRDRSRWVGSLEKGLEQAKNEMRTPERPRSVERAGGEIIDPLQVQLTGNPVFKLFMAGAGMANELVKSIPLTENRDRLKESREDIEKSAQELDEKLGKDLAGSAYEEKAKGHRDKLDKALGETKEGQKAREDQKKKDQERQEREKKDREWFERGGGWGR